MANDAGLHLRLRCEEPEVVLRSLFHASPVALVLVDSDGFLAGFNDAFLAMVGLTPAALLDGQAVNVRQFIRAFQPHLVSDLERALRGEMVDIPEFFLRLPEGGRGGQSSERLARGFRIWARAWPVRDSTGVVKHVAVLLDDVSDRRELEALVVQGQKMEAISTMAGGLAHDVNNILSGVVGYASLLASRLPRGSTDYDAAMTILDSADQAANLASQLMIIARRSALQLQPVDLGDLLPRVAALLARTLGSAHTLTLDLASDIGPVDGDRPLLEQVLTNLCLNARDAMPEGGTVSLRAHDRKFGEWERRPLASMPAGDYVQIDVEDLGVGMTPEVSGRIFEPFFTTKPMGPATGLGLAVVHGIVKAHRGFVVAESHPGRGSVFSVFLPHCRPIREQFVVAPVVPEYRPEPIGSLSVLVIDDEPIVRRVMTEMLARLGHLAVAVDGMEPAMDLLMRDRSRFDVLIVDVFLPEKSGLELVETLRRAELNLPALVCTGYTSPEVQARVQALSGTMILPKPFNVDTLKIALSRIIGSVSP